MSQVNYCQRQDLGLVRVSGADARAFLHAQTTQEINDLAESETKLAAWLSAKGRVRALIDVVPSNEGFYLITDADNVGWLAEQLGIYVLRSAVELKVVADADIYSFCGAIDEWLEELGFDLKPGVVGKHGNTYWLGKGQSCVTVFGKPESLAAFLANLPGGEIDTALLAGIALGRPAITAAVRDRYIPQMLNLDLLGAISFTKGCYPGQEIVARTQNLGEVKRRLRRFSIGSGACPRPGDAILNANVNFQSQTVGEINRVAATETGYELLAVVQLDAAAGELLLESDGRKLYSQPLPDDI